MNRKLSFLAAGLALSAVLTGCTSTAGVRSAPVTTPGYDFGRDTANGYGYSRRAPDGSYNRGTTGVTRGTAGVTNRGTAGVTNRNNRTNSGLSTGYIGADGRWHPFAGSSVGVPDGTGAPIASYPDLYNR